MRAAVLQRRSSLKTAAVVTAMSMLALGAAVGPMRASAATLTMCGNSGSVQPLQHIIWIWMENEGYWRVIGNSAAPYQNNTIAVQCGLATNFHNESHGSKDNYIAAVSGQNILNTPFINDCVPSSTCSSSASTIFAQLGSSGAWRSYEENMVSNCQTTNAGLYTVEHNPAPYFTGLASSCPTWDVPMGDVSTQTGQFYDDLRAGTLPAFSFITPNTVDDAHDTGPADGDKWLSKIIPIITASPNYQSGNTAIFITNDEGGGSDYTLNENCSDPNQGTTKPSCHVPTFVIAPYVPAGARSATFFTHYSMLRTAEELLGLPLLGLASTAASMSSPFNLVAGVTPPPPTGTEYVTNRSVEADLTGWGGVWNPTYTKVSRPSGDAHDGTYAVRIDTTKSTGASAGFNDKPTWVSSTTSGASYAASVWIKTGQSNTKVCLRRIEYTSAWTKIASVDNCVTPTDTAWHQLASSYAATGNGNRLRFTVYSTFLTPGRYFLADDFSELGP